MDERCAHIGIPRQVVDRPQEREGLTTIERRGELDVDEEVQQVVFAGLITKLVIGAADAAGRRTDNLRVKVVCPVIFDPGEQGCPEADPSYVVPPSGDRR
jgi:hypothetical protein